MDIRDILDGQVRQNIVLDCLKEKQQKLEDAFLTTKLAAPLEQPVWESRSSRGPQAEVELQVANPSPRARSKESQHTGDGSVTHAGPGPIKSAHEAATEEVKALKLHRKRPGWSSVQRSGSMGSNRERTKLQRVVESPQFDSICALVIVLNSISIGASVQHITMHNREHWASVAIGYFCSAFFFVELLMRAGSEGRMFFFSDDKFWNTFDLILVINSIVDLILTLSGNDPGSLGSGARIIRMLRIVRIIRVFRFFRELNLLAATIVDSVMSLFWAMVLCGLIMYVFSITITRGAYDYILTHELGPDSPMKIYFGSLQSTVYTLARAMLQGQGWGEITDELLQLNPLFPTLFLFYLAFAVLAMANIITGVFCDNVRQVAQTERTFIAAKEMEVKERYTREMQELFGEIDDDGSGTLNWSEFEAFFKDPRVQGYFKAIEVDASDTRRLWRLLDSDNSGEVGIDEFLSGCIKFKGHAMSIDVYTILQECKKLSKTLSSMEKCMHRVSPISTRIHAPVVAVGHEGVSWDSKTWEVDEAELAAQHPISADAKR